MTRQDVYSKFEALEEEVSHCYFIFYERSIKDAPLARFWADAAIDELQHASILRFCQEHNLLGDLIGSAGVTDRIEQLMEGMRDVVAKTVVTPDEAFAAALIIEASELDEAYEQLTRPLKQAHLILYQAIHASLRLHHYNFAETAARFCQDSALAAAFRTLGHVDRQMFAERG